MIDESIFRKALGAQATIANTRLQPRDVSTQEQIQRFRGNFGDRPMTVIIHMARSPWYRPKPTGGQVDVRSAS
jgi:hypothetical protein